MDGNTHSDCREVRRGYMILKINFVDSKIMNMSANLFVKIEQVTRFVPNTVIYKQLSSSPQREGPFLSSTSVLAIPANRRYILESQPIGKKPTQFY